MKARCVHACSLSIMAGGFVLLSGCGVEPNGTVHPGVVVVAPLPPPPPVVVEAPVMVPETYVWDGYEYVGFVGGQYCYLGPSQVWLVVEPFRLERFHGWERNHPDWRMHATRHEHFRNDRNGHFQPRHDEPGRHGEPGRPGGAPQRGEPQKGEPQKGEPRNGEPRNGTPDAH